MFITVVIIVVVLALLARFHEALIEMVLFALSVDPILFIQDHFAYLINLAKLRREVRLRRTNIRRNLPRRCAKLLQSLHSSDDLIDKEDLFNCHSSFAVAEGLRVRYKLLNPTATADNRRIVTDRLVKEWEKRGVRPSHISKALPLAVEIALSRTEAEEEAEFARGFLNQAQGHAK